MLPARWVGSLLPDGKSQLTMGLIDGRRGISHPRGQHGVLVPKGAVRLQALAVPAGVDGVLDPGRELVVPAPEIAAAIDLGVVVEHVRDVEGGITVHLGRVRRHGRLDEVGERLVA